VNSRIIASVSEDDFDPNTDEGASTIVPTFQVSDVLMELEFIKRELYNQINLAKNLEKEKHALCN